MDQPKEDKIGAALYRHFLKVHVDQTDLRQEFLKEIGNKTNSLDEQRKITRKLVFESEDARIINNIVQIISKQTDIPTEEIKEYYINTILDIFQKQD